MSSPYTIRIFVPEGDPNGLRIIENMNWTGTGAAFPRDKWASALKHGDIKKPGIYILWGYSNSAEDPRPRVYIGEGDNVSDRIDSHLEHKDFWGNAIVFTSNNLNKAYIRYIESMLITRAKKYKRCVVENGTELGAIVDVVSALVGDETVTTGHRRIVQVRSSSSTADTPLT